MIKVIRNSSNLSTWYLDPGQAPNEGNGKSISTPFQWYNHIEQNNNNKVINLPSKSYIAMILEAGKTYNFYNYSYNYDGYLQLFDNNGNELTSNDDSGGGEGASYPGGSFDYSISTTGTYICGVGLNRGDFDNSSYKDDLTVKSTNDNSPPIDNRTDPGWKKKTGLADGNGWNIKTGKLFKYRSIENAGIKFNDFPKSGLILYYNMDDENSTCVDTVNGYNMTIQAGSGLTYGNDGKFGKCWESTGYSYLKCNTAPNITDNFSINLWMYKTVNTGGPNSTIFELGTHASNTGFGFYLSGSNITWRLNQLYQYYVSDVIPLNEWIMLSYTFDGNYCRVYKNANIIIETSNTQKPNLSNVIVAFARSDSSTSEDYRGKLDEIGVWNRALSLEELNKLYNNNKGSIFK